MEGRIKKIPLIIASLFLLSSCTSKLEKIAGGKSWPEQTIKNFTFDKYSAGVAKWSFKASRADIYDSSQRVDATSINVLFFKDGATDSVLTADTAAMNTGTGDIEMSGNVVIFSLLKCTTIYTDAAKYYQKAGRITSDSPVRQERADFTVKGRGLDADVGLVEVNILHDVKVTRKP
jgi:LPS export ABC transporter protein LptC